MNYLIIIIFFITTNDIREYESICDGLWEEFKVNENEFVGYVTIDNKFISTSTGATFNSAISNTMLYFNGMVYVKVKTAKTYKGSISNRFGFFVPIKAMIHSHNPKCKMPVTGVEEISKDDIKIAKKYPNIRHFVYGCNWIAEFDKEGIIESNDIKVKSCEGWGI